MKLIKRTICIVLLTLIFVGAMPERASAKSIGLTTHVGIVKASALNLRSGPSTGNSILKTAPKGDYVTITDKIGDWFQVNFNLVKGYMHQAYLDIYASYNVELGYGRITGSKVNLRSGAGTGYSTLAQLAENDAAYVIGLQNQWYKVICKGRVGYVRSDYLKLTEVPYENKASVKSPIFYQKGKSTGIVPSADALKDPSNSQTIADKIVSDARKHLGTPYVWGGSAPGGFDCSGFTQYIYKQSGISLPRTTTDQYKLGTYVEKSKLQPGDLVFLANTYRNGISHVGIYIGDGNMIHASSSKGITISSLSSNYNKQHYYGARRIL